MAGDTGQRSSSTGRPQYVHLDFREGILTVRPVGPGITQREAPIITDDARRAMGECGQALRVLVIDLNDVMTMSSMGLAMCIDLRHQAQRAGAKTVLYGMRAEIARLFRMMRLDRLYKIARTTNELHRFAA